VSEQVDHEFVERLNWMQEPTGPFRDLCADCGLHRSAHPQPNAQPAQPNYHNEAHHAFRLSKYGIDMCDVCGCPRAPSAQPPAPEIKRGKLVRADDPESREWWRKVHEINDLPSNARLSHAESILRELAAYVAMPVIHGPDVLSLASQAHTFLADGSAHYEWHSESRLKGMRDVVRIAFESVGGGGYSAGRMCERLGITREEGYRAGIQWLANAMTDLAESDYLAREASAMVSGQVVGYGYLRQFDAGEYRCKICGTPWRCHPDGTWSIRTSRLAERCCDNHPGFLLVMERESE
jgi:hypothetical protein